MDLLEWGLAQVEEGGSGVGPLNSHAQGKCSEHMETLEDLAGVMRYTGSGSTHVTCPSVFLAVNWNDFIY